MRTLSAARWSFLILTACALTVVHPVIDPSGAQVGAQSTRAVTPTAHHNTDAQGVALKGYDPVAYFTRGAPTPGSATITSTVNGVTYRFATEANRAAFQAAPEQYQPAYGGYCAMGMAGGRKFDIDPTAWRIEDGTLYLNKDPKTQQVWLRDVPGNIRKADAKWPAVIAKP
jgi:YHS domain-containing protein